MAYRKLGKASDQRNAMMRSLATALLHNGRIITTEQRAKELRGVVEPLITLAAREYNHTVEVTKTVATDDGKKEEKTFTNDAPSKLHARRLITAKLYNITDGRKADEKLIDYKERVSKLGKNPTVEKLFREIAPKYVGRKGGYTRIVKMGPRKGDAAEMVIIELV